MLLYSTYRYYSVSILCTGVKKYIRGENMNFDYAKDSKEQRPYEHYLAAYKELDPK